MEGGKEGGREGGRDGGREGGRERGREEGGREGGSEGGREGGMTVIHVLIIWATVKLGDTLAFFVKSCCSCRTNNTTTFMFRMLQPCTLF